MGTVYMIRVVKNIYNKSNKSNKLDKSDKSNYALKIEKIIKKDIKPHNKSEIWRELDFYKNFGHEFPEQFVNLIEYDFINNCEHVQKYSFDINLFPKQMQNKLKKKASSNYCIRKVFELMDGNLDEIIKKLNTKQIYSMIIQITNGIKILHSNNYVHGDFHVGNIGWTKTNDKYIIIDGLKVKTFGYRFKLIDFGQVLSNKFILDNREEKFFSWLIVHELGHLKYIVTDNNFLNGLRKKKIKVDQDKIYRKIKNTDQFEIIKNFKSDVQDQIFLFELLFEDIYQKIVMGESYIKTIPNKLFLPKEDILIIIKMYETPDLLIKYFYSKIL